MKQICIVFKYQPSGKTTIGRVFFPMVYNLFFLICLFSACVNLRKIKHFKCSCFTQNTRPQSVSRKYQKIHFKIKLILLREVSQTIKSTPTKQKHHNYFFVFFFKSFLFRIFQKFLPPCDKMLASSHVGRLFLYGLTY